MASSSRFLFNRINYINFHFKQIPPRKNKKKIKKAIYIYIHSDKIPRGNVPFK